MLLHIVECFILEHLLIKGAAQSKEELRVKLAGKQGPIVALFDQAHVSIALHSITALLMNELLELLLVSRSCELFGLGNGECFPDDLLVVALFRHVDGRQMLHRCDRRTVIKLHVFVDVEDFDGARLGGHEVGSEDHLAEAIVVHVLQTCLLLCRVYIDSLAFLVDLGHKFSAHMVSGQKLMVEPVLFLVVIKHFADGCICVFLSTSKF